jgi:hypothetical protein
MDEDREKLDNNASYEKIESDELDTMSNTKLKIIISDILTKKLITESEKDPASKQK